MLKEKTSYEFINKITNKNKEDRKIYKRLIYLLLFTCQL
jgi:hypothetical protein